jgi:hypothetical protein
MTTKEFTKLPKNVKEILATFDENEDPYTECERIILELGTVGYIADFDLGGILFDIKPKKNKR